MTSVNLGGNAALVTGAANGLGHAISTYLADAGAIGIGFDKEAWGSRREDAELDLGPVDHAPSSGTFHAS